MQSISTNKDDFIHLNIDTYETLDAEVQLPTASVSNETIGVDYTGGTDQAMDEGIVDESHETVESGDGPDLYAQFISATGVTYNDLLDSLLSKDRKTKVTKDNFLQYFESVGRLSAGLTKAEILICLDRIKLQNQQMYFAKSWNKQKLAQYLYNCLTDQSNLSGAETNRKRVMKRKNPTKLSAMCKKIIRKFPKWLLNIIVSEYEFMPEYDNWKTDLPFTNPTKIVFGSFVEEVTWFSKPEYNNETFTHVFSYLDIHHLVTNCRTKVCKDGIPQRGISNNAWKVVARENKTNLKIPHVEDLVDKQSDAIARETFSAKVEGRMVDLGFPAEAELCKLVREFYDAEDEPGLTSAERCERRLRLREWLLQDVNFSSFPPYGSHIRGIPLVMFQGFLTNIDRRMQIVPYIKSGTYNVRALGSLEVENFFGQFQDLDPKGSGVLKAEEVPAALESACQLLQTCMRKDRKFDMVISRKTKVYPIHEMMEDCSIESSPVFMTPLQTDMITLK